MTNMSGTGKYFKQPAVAMSFVLLTVGAGKHIRNDKQRIWQEFLKWKAQQVQSGQYYSETAYTMDNIAWEDYAETAKVISDSAEIIYDDYNKDGQTDATITFTSFRMDGDDTLMSSKERIQIFSRGKSYTVSHNNIETH